uniref:Uncharacterized protein n=1 Tax=Rhizophora mucronata TaxID=61149 RepID=A0A2P2N519_RHIMU
MTKVNSISFHHHYLHFFPFYSYFPLTQSNLESTPHQYFYPYIKRTSGTMLQRSSEVK